MKDIVISRHAMTRMTQYDVSEEEIREVLETGNPFHVEGDRMAKELVLVSGYRWRGRDYPHREVSVIYVEEGTVTTVVTVWARYGVWEVVS